MEEQKDYNPCVDRFIEMIKLADPDMSKQMKSHHKKQFIKMAEDESKQNLLYKMCLKTWEMEDEIRYLNDKVSILQSANRELKQKI